MKNLKINKLAQNRLTEKEMGSLISGTHTWCYSNEIHFTYSAKYDISCDALCSCTFHPPLLDPVSSNGFTTATSAMNLNRIA
ncbi:MAG: hypothetical protein LBI45_09195 [Bacteroidales bacterium]|jgi:hypothetical protein|nr:hypothetical protein [Bacteroidales bacterium]